jgi:hypothetical protein
LIITPPADCLSRNLNRTLTCHLSQGLVRT